MSAKQGGEQMYSFVFTSSVLEGCGWHYQPPVILPLARHSTHCTESWVGLGAGLDRFWKSRPHHDL